MKKTSIAFAVLCVAGATFGQGSLTPPGIPAPTMKTLDQVEPRIPISSAPYTISQSGSYYLTANLTSSGHGIVVATSGVTIDLMGFTIDGDRDYLDYGIFLDGATNNLIEQVVVKNGIIRNFGRGIHAEYGQNCRFEHFISDSNSSHGINLHSQYGQCNGNTIKDCTFSGNGSVGIYLDGYSGQCDGNMITDCAISGNESRGIYLYGGVGGQCDGNTISDCTINGNGSDGIFLYGWNGQCLGNVITDCTIRKNANEGIQLGFAEGNRVEGNHITGQTGATTYGIHTSSSSENLIFRNTCVGQMNNFQLDSDDVYGPIVTTSGELSTSGAAAHPLANFSF